LQEHNSISDNECKRMSINKFWDQSSTANTINDDNCLENLSISNDGEPLTSIESVKYQHFPEGKKGRKGCSKFQSKLTQFAKKASSSNAPNKFEQVTKVKANNEIPVGTKQKVDNSINPRTIACRRPFLYIPFLIALTLASSTNVYVKSKESFSIFGLKNYFDVLIPRV